MDRPNTRVNVYAHTWCTVDKERINYSHTKIELADRNLAHPTEYVSQLLLQDDQLDPMVYHLLVVLLEYKSGLQLVHIELELLEM